MVSELIQTQELNNVSNIEAITNCFIEKLKPVKIFLFGSFADGSYDKDSDYDFYIVINDSDDPWEIRRKTRKAIRNVQDRPVDIVVGTNSRFQRYGNSQDTLFVEGEVFRNGRLLYDQAVNIDGKKE